MLLAPLSTHHRPEHVLPAARAGDPDMESSSGTSISLPSSVTRWAIFGASLSKAESTTRALACLQLKHLAQKNQDDDDG